MPTQNSAHNNRHGMIVVHPFGPFQEGQFLDDPATIERLIADGQSWRISEAVMLSPVP